MSTRLGFKPIGSAILGVALCLGTGAYAQDATPAANPRLKVNARNTCLVAMDPPLQ